jgi:phosphoglycerol geranylgeranyltransferase
MESILERLSAVRHRRGAGLLTLLDPDRLELDELERRAVLCADAGADAILIGTSLMLSSSKNAEVYGRLRRAVSLPLISFPGGIGQVVPDADAILFLSMVSGRNPELLIGQQAKAAPLVKEYGLDVISTAYMLVESGTLTSTEYMSNTRPIPRRKNDIAMAHALAAEYIGMQTVYLEAGSGAQQPVPDSMVQAVSSYVSLPVIVGGGIRDPETARAKVEAGASFVVVGSVLEDGGGELADHMRALATAVHIAE